MSRHPAIQAVSRLMKQGPYGTSFPRKRESRGGGGGALQGRFPASPPLDSRLRGNDSSGDRCLGSFVTAWKVLLLVLLLPVALAGCGVVGSPALPSEPCVAVHDGDCVELEQFNEAAEAAAEESREHTGFWNQWGLTHINADEAYGNLSVLMGPDVEPGAGVTIGVLDTGIDLEHPSIAGNDNRKVTEEFTPGAIDETLSEAGLLSHGTAVASVAAGARTDSEIGHHGVAWGADLAVFALTLGSGDGVYRPVPVEALPTVDAEDAALYGQVFSWRDGDRKVDILNLSFGYQGLIDGYTEEDLRDNYATTLAALAQADSEEKVILVWAAGNSHGDACDSATVEFCPRDALNAVSVDINPGIPARIEELQGHSVAVVALSPNDGRIASFSNRCGIAADFCIAAPGEAIRSAYFGNISPRFSSRDYANLRGTSFAAPMVSGGLAIMKQLFRDQLSNTDLVARLFDTADRSGFYADPAIYGRGSMDLGAATSPVGVLEVPVGTSVGANGFRLLSTSISPGTAFGDGLRRSLGSREVMAVDRLGAPFWYRLGDFTGTAGGPSVAARLRSFLAEDPSRVGGESVTTQVRGRTDRGAGEESAGVSAYAEADESVHGGAQAGPGGEMAALSVHATRLEASSDVLGSHMSLAEGAVQATLAARGGVSAAAFTTKGLPGQRPTLGAALSWRRVGSPWGVRAGWIGEPKTLLGSVGEGGFGGLAADTSFLGVDARTDLGGWRIGANAEVGIVVPDARGGFVDGVSSLATSAFALHASRALAGAGAVRFSVSQPLRVERGRASMTVPVSRTKAGAVSYDALSAGLAPSGRQMDFSGEWLRPLPKGELRLGAVYSHRPGHRRGADPEVTFLGGWRWVF